MTALLILATAYGTILVLLFAYGANGYVLLRAARRFEQPTAPTPTAWPSVAVQLPVYNERDVVERIVEAAGKMRYPGRLEVQVLDDSTDDTCARAAAAVARLEHEGVTASHVRRTHRDGFKAGALAAALEHTDAQVLLILDADFVPEPDMLERAVPFLAGDDVACVQTRWRHLNRDQASLTRAQALGIDVHFAVEQRARAADGWPVAFNGSGGLWKRAALEDAGGWSADTLTEDLDLCYRAWLRGWRVQYVDHIGCPAELPETVEAFKAQQRRWARGSTEVALKLLGPIWRSRATVGAKLQATLHLTHYNVHPLMLLSAALALPLGMVGAAGSIWWTILPPLALATGGPLAMSWRTAAAEGLSRAERLRDVASLMLLGTGLAVSNTFAVFAALSPKRGVFERTPKGGRRSSYRVNADRLGLLECACALACAALATWLVTRGIYAMAPFLLLYATGFARVGVATLREGAATRGRRPAIEARA